MTAKNIQYSSFTIPVTLTSSSGEAIECVETVRATNESEARVLAEVRAMERVYGAIHARRVNKIASFGKVSFDLKDRDFRMRQDNKNGLGSKVGHAVGISQIFSASSQAKNTMVNDFRMMTSPFYGTFRKHQDRKRRMQSNLYSYSDGKKPSFEEDHSSLFRDLSFSSKSYVISAALINTVAAFLLIVAGLFIIIQTPYKIPGAVSILLSVPAGVMGFLHFFFWAFGFYIGGKADVDDGIESDLKDKKEAKSAIDEELDVTAHESENADDNHGNDFRYEDVAAPASTSTQDNEDKSSDRL